MTDAGNPEQDSTSYGGLWRRFIALSLDGLVFCAFFFPATKIVKGVWLMSPSDHRWVNGLFITDPLCVAFLVVMIGYFAVLEGAVGTTAGKWVMGLRVIKADDGGRPGLVRGLFRNLLRLVDGLPAFNILGVVLILRSKERARFGDRYAGTRVLNVR
jgi:uncharacterized RDD family membrane protein YckC